MADDADDDDERWTHLKGNRMTRYVGYGSSQTFVDPYRGNDRVLTPLRPSDSLSGGLWIFSETSRKTILATLSLILKVDRQPHEEKPDATALERHPTTLYFGL